MEAKEAFTVLSDSKARAEYDRRQQVALLSSASLRPAACQPRRQATSSRMFCRVALTGTAWVTSGDRRGSGRRPPRGSSRNRRSFTGLASSSETSRKSSASGGGEAVVSRGPCSRSLPPSARAYLRTSWSS